MNEPRAELATLTGEEPRAAAAPAAAGPEPTLRRFHFGDPLAAVAGPEPGTLPAALARFRGSAVRGGWPLLVDPDAAAERWAQPFSEWLESALRDGANRVLADQRARVERRLAAGLAGRPQAAPARAALAAALAEVADELGLAAAARAELETASAALVAALPASAVMVAFGRRSPLALATLAARRRSARARAALAAEALELGAALDALLDADRERQPREVPAGERAGRLGALGSRLVDADRLAEIAAHRSGGAPLDATRRARLEWARTRLAAAEDSREEPIWVVPARQEGPDLLAPTRLASDPCAAAIGLFDESAAAVAELVRALRVARLEVAGAFDAERHGPWLDWLQRLDRLDWHAFAPEELALVRPVLVLVRSGDLLAGGLPSLSRLLLGVRPIHVVTLAGERGEAEEAGIRFEPGYAGLGLREAFVHQGSIARPAALALGLERAFDGARPALHVVDAPEVETRELDSWLLAAARVAGRAAPLFRYEPEAGASWARRLRFEDNPEPGADWPTEPFPDGAEAAGAPREAAFTYADAALADPHWQGHFARVEAAGDELLPLAEWLALEPVESARRLPFVWGARPDGGLERLVVSRALVRACRDRASFWRTLEELAGVRNEHVDAAVAEARAEERAAAARALADLEARHAAELERARADADAAAADRIVAALFELEPLSGPIAASAGRTRVQEVAGAQVPQAGVAPAAEAPAGKPAAEPGGAAVGRAASSEPEEAWVDTALCTSCDECTRRYPSVFAYNANKQAFVKNPRGARFRDLVAAAEVCTAKIIHPGTPWDPAEPDLAAWVARAKVFE